MTVKELRTKSNFSQKQLAFELGVSQATICSWENGTKFPRKNMLDKMSALFGVSIADIMGETAKPDDEEHTEEAVAPAPTSNIDPQLLALLTKLTPSQVQRVLDFASGMVASNLE